MEPKRLFHPFGVVMVSWGIVFYIAINTFGVRWNLYINQHVRCEAVFIYKSTRSVWGGIYIYNSIPSRRDRSLRRKRHPHLDFHAVGMEPKRHISYHIQLVHTFGVVIVSWGIVFYVAINTFGVRRYFDINQHLRCEVVFIYKSTPSVWGGIYT